MSNIDKRALREAAEKATSGRVGDRIDGSGSIKYQCFGNDGSLVLQADHKNMEYGFIGGNSEADELFFRLCDPATVLALLDELEAKETESEWMRKRIEELAKAWEVSDEQRVNWFQMAHKLGEDLEAAEKRIAELEARKPDLYLCRVNRGGEELYSPCGKDYPRGRGYFAAAGKGE